MLYFKLLHYYLRYEIKRCKINSTRVICGFFKVKENWIFFHYCSCKVRVVIKFSALIKEPRSHLMDAQCKFLQNQDQCQTKGWRSFVKRGSTEKQDRVCWKKINVIQNFPFTVFNSWLDLESPTWSAWKWQHQGATIWSCQNKGLLKILEVALKMDASSWNFRHLSAFKTLIRWMEISLWRAEHSDMQWLHLVGESRPNCFWKSQ